MSIYTTLWTLHFPAKGDDHFDCDWVKVTAQGVPPHIGTPTRGHGYEDGDPYHEFLPPPVEVDADGWNEVMRAVVFVMAGTAKGTDRNGQEYVRPLLVISGREYKDATFEGLLRRICDALRGDSPRVVAKVIEPGGRIRTIREGDSAK